jgi:uncharacterized protein YjiK
MRGVLATVSLLLGALVAGVSCSTTRRDTADSRDSTLLAAREARYQVALARRDTGGSVAPIARWHLPQYLQEISGLALTRDGRLLTHADQRAKVFEIDYRRGLVVKDFSVGNPAAHGDFEAITTVGDSVFLLASDGVIYRSIEAGKNRSVQYTMTDTGLGNICEFEGMTYDPAGKVMLLACKRAFDKSLKDSLVIFRWSLSDEKANAKPSHLAVPLSRIIGSHEWDGFRASDITIDPFNGNYVLIASRERAIIEITPAGDVVFSASLPPGHEQAEGLAITRDSVLLISDEARGTQPTLTLYRWPLRGQ